jgi:hypothetical protein
MFLIYALQPIKCDVRINLRRGNIGVPKNGLHSAQVGAVLDHVGGATVPQHVRTGMAAG